MTLHTKYEVFRPCGLRQDCYVFPILAYVLWWNHFWPQGHNLNKFGRGLLSDATYQIIKATCVVV